MILILDIDMTLADGSKRLAAAGAEPDKADKPAYDAWLAKAQAPGTLLHDPIVDEMKDLVLQLAANKQNEIHYITSRSEKHRLETFAWLTVNGFPPEPLWMRGDADYRQAAAYKAEVMGKIIPAAKEHVSVVFLDDDPEIAELCQRNGWLHLQPNLKRVA
jgi:hypothetical protein